MRHLQNIVAMQDHIVLKKTNSNTSEAYQLIVSITSVAALQQMLTSSSVLLTASDSYVDFNSAEN